MTEQSVHMKQFEEAKTLHNNRGGRRQKSGDKSKRDALKAS